jgi:hemerythrin
MDAVYKPIYDSGHPKLDRDHEILVDLLRELKARDFDSANVELMGMELLAYLDAHFEHEEQLMDLYGYPGTPEHRDAHNRFRSQAEGLARDCALPDATVQPLVAAIERWLESHMQGEDARFAEFLGERGAEACEDETGVFSASERLANWPEQARLKPRCCDGSCDGSCDASCDCK